MKDETLETERAIVDALADLNVAVTEVTCSEYVRGDPTKEDSSVTGVEISLTAYKSYEEDSSGTSSRFRYDP